MASLHQVNPNIAADYVEVGRWLQSFATSHAKRENAHVEVEVDTAGPRAGRSYGLRLHLAGRVAPPASAAPIELTFTEVADGRTRFTWCAALADRVRATTRALLADASAGRRVSS